MTFCDSTSPSKLAEINNLATLTTKSDYGFAVLVARSRVNSKLTSNAVPVTNAEVKRSVRLIDDTDVIFPPADIQSWEIPSEMHFTDSPNPIDIGGFTLTEIFDVFKPIGTPGVSEDFYLRKPLLLRGVAPAVGTVLAASGGADIFDQVVAVETRGNLSLVQLKPAEPSDVYGRVKFDFSYQHLVNAGLIPDDTSGAAVGLLSGRETTPSTDDKDDKKCTFEGATEKSFEISKPKIGQDLLVRLILNFNQETDYGDIGANPPRLPKAKLLRAEFGFDAELKDYSPKIKLSGSQEIKVKCNLIERTAEFGARSAAFQRESQVGQRKPRYAQAVGAVFKVLLKLIVARVKYNLILEATGKLSGETEFDVGFKINAKASPKLALNYPSQPYIEYPKTDDFEKNVDGSFDPKKILETALSETKVRADVKLSLFNTFTGGLGIKGFNKDNPAFSKSLSAIDKALQGANSAKELLNRFEARLSKGILKILIRVLLV